MNSSADAATAFINEHTVVDNDVPLLDECPICLDNYSTESCLEIIGIQGCAHRIGMKCLQEMLSCYPNEEKKCPLCRTVWVAAPAGVTLSQSSRLTGIERYTVWDRAMTPQAGARTTDQPANNTAPGGGTGSSYGQSLEGFSTRSQNQQHTTRQNPILVDSDSDTEGYEAQLDHYEQLTQDIESVRMRARNTQVSRARRRQGFNATRLSRMLTPQDENSRNGNTIDTIPGPYSATNNSAARRARTPPVARGLASLLPEFSDRGHDRQRARRPLLQEHTQNLPSFPDAPLNFDGNEDSIEVLPPQAQSTRTSIRTAIRTTMRTRLLERRETELNSRETALDTREVSLAQREQNLAQRERDLAQREHRANQLVTRMREQQNEVQNLMRRHVMELEGAVR
ncbi:hypothetical protein BKA66DRAFT_570087 [Pyrenochaeta sp. MPI-SDFR-AT-0127]|nr:hypothetical protein BKA66DRAFT_570087 [Pyrenochaeta sp. MPI-SDFR-AT-0127]